MRELTFIFISLSVLAGPLFALAGPLPSGREPAPLFASDEVLELTLEMDLRSVIRDIDDERMEHPATLSYISAAGNRISLPLEIRTRGHFRRDPMNCNFPPLRLDFLKDSTGGTLFEGQNKLKLVTHCRTRGDHYNQNVLKEYLAYRFYNALSDESLRVRLVEITYLDTDGKSEPLVKSGLLIEPEQQLAERTGARIFEMENVRQDHCDLSKTNRLAVYEYMIGNTDWSIPAGHNIVMLRYDESSPPVPVPYDFDWSGLVDSPYAVPNEILGIDDVKTRLFRGTCRSPEDLEETLTLFREKENEFYRLVASVPGLEEKEREKIEKYLEQFFRILDNPRMSYNEFQKNCLTR